MLPDFELTSRRFADRPRPAASPSKRQPSLSHPRNIPDVALSRSMTSICGDDEAHSTPCLFCANEPGPQQMWLRLTSVIDRPSDAVPCPRERERESELRAQGLKPAHPLPRPLKGSTVFPPSFTSPSLKPHSPSIPDIDTGFHKRQVPIQTFPRQKLGFAIETRTRATPT
jgi:hypothetical protein